MPPGFLALLASGMALGFFVAALLLLGHYERQTGLAFSQADPRWRFQSVFGALMLVSGLSCFAYGFYAQTGDLASTNILGIRQELLRGTGEVSWAWVALAIGLIPIPVLILELLLSRWFQQVGFTRHYEINAREWPLIGVLVRRLREPDSNPLKPSGGSLSEIWHFRALQLSYSVTFVVVWTVMYFVSPLLSLIGRGHFAANRLRLKDRPADRRLQTIVDLLVGFTVLLAFAALFVASGAWHALHPIGVADAINTLIKAFLLLVVVTAAIALAFLGYSTIGDSKSRRRAEAFLALLFIVAYAATSWFDLLALPVARLPSLIEGFGGATPLALSALSFFLIVIFIRDLTAANTLHLTQIKESVN